MSDTETLVRSYLSAVAARDFDLARTFLTDREFSYTSPIGSIEDADLFIQNISAAGPILERLDIRKCMVSSTEAVVILDVKTTMFGYVTRPVAMLFYIGEGCIKSIEAIFDASEYNKMFTGDS